jgi:EpsD family peptidyl-prolyl cis-trans isomerase
MIDTPFEPSRGAARQPRPGARALAASALVAALVALAACGDGKGGGSAPTGQVVARLNGEDITQLEVQAELAATPLPPNIERKDAERIALNNIITRRMLMNEAKARKLDQNPQFQQQQRRTSEQLFVQALAADIARKVEDPTMNDADTFIRENPSLFAQRKIFVLDQIQFVRPDNVNELPLGQAKTMAEVEKVLSDAGIEYRRLPASLDSLGANPAFIAEVVKVLEKNPREVFVFANQQPGAPAPVVTVNQVTETRIVPFTGERARQFATNFLRQQNVQKALTDEVKRQQEAAKAQVVYQEGWGPPETPQAPDIAAQGVADAATPQTATRLAPPAGSPAAAPAEPQPAGN